MDFDIRTAILALGVGNLVFGSILQLFQSGAERPQRIPFLAACKLLQGVGWLLLSGRGSIPDLLSFTVGNSCLLSGIAYECWAMYRIAGRPVSRTRHVYSAAGITLVCILATFLTAADRIVVASFVAVIFYALSGRAMLNRPGEKPWLHRYIGGSAWLLAVVLSVRGLWALVAPENFTLFAGNAIQLITFATFYYLMLTNDVGVLLLTKQIADRELRESETRFRLAFDNANVGVCLVDTQGKLFRVNRQMSEMFGYSQAELESMNVNDITRPEYADVSPRFIQQSKNREVDHAEFEKEYIHKQGRSVWGQVSSSLVRNTEGEPLYFISHVLDITGRKQAEEALRESEEKFREFFNTSRDCVFITSSGGSWIDFNDSALELFGHDSRTDLAATPILQLYADAEERKTFIALIQRQGFVKEYPVKLKRKTGAEFDALITTSCLLNADGSTRGFAGTIRDITARQRAETALRESEARYQDLYENAPDMYLSVEPQTGRILQCNQTVARLTGFEKHDLIGRPVFELYHPDCLDAARQAMRRFVATGEVRDAELQVRRQDGNRIDVSLNVSAVRDATGQIVQSRSSWRDITDRKQAEAALRVLSSRQQALLTAIPDIIVEVDQNKVFTWTNPAGLEFYGEDVLGKEAAFYFEGEQDTYRIITPLFDGNEEVIYLESWQRRQDGEKRLLAWWCRVLKNDGGNVIGAISTARDITDRKQAEAALRESEERFHAMFAKHAAVMLLVEPATGAILDANLAAEKFYGYPVARLCSLNIAELNQLPPDQIQLERQSALRGERNYFIFPHRLADGAIRIVEIHSSPIALANKSVLFSIIHDITDRQRAESQREAALEALRASEERYRSILNASPDDITITDLEGRILMVSPAALTMVNCDREEEMVGRLLADFIVPEDRDRAASNIGLMFQGVMTGIGEYRGLRADGSIFDMEVNGEFIRDAQGQPIQMVFIARDITERKQVEDTLRELNAELQTRNEELDAFAHTVAHDLKNPLGIIMGYAELLADDATLPADNAQQALVAISRSGQKAADIIDSLFLLASVRKQDVQVAPLDMARIVDEVLLRLADAIQASNADLHLPDRASWPVALGHAPWIEEIWVNYLSNALKYGGPRPRIDLGAALLPPLSATARERGQGGGFIRFSVRDYGPGLTPEQQQRLFTPFERLGQAQVKGHGLGLSVVRRITDKLGGQAGVDSQPGQGSTFYFTLPAAE